MSTQVQRRRGTTGQHAAFTGALGETTFDTDLNRPVVHDGLLPGGFPSAMLHLAQTFPLSQTFAAANNFFGNTTTPDNAIVFLNPVGVGTNTLDFNTNGTMDANFLRKYNTTPFQIELAASGNLDLVVDSRNVATGTSVRFLTNGIRDSGTQTLLAEFFDNGTVNLTGTLTLADATLLRWLTRSAISSPSDGVLRLTNNAVTGFTRLQFGGTTSSFPAIGRNGINLEILGADGAGPSGLYIYNTKTSATNFERLNIQWVGGGTAQILTEKGTAGGAATELQFGTDGIARLAITVIGDIGWGTGLTTSILETDGSILIDSNLFVADVSADIVQIAGIFEANRGAGTLGFFGSLAAQQDVVLLLNNVTAGGTADQLDDFNPDTNEADLGTDMVDIASVPNRLEVNTNFTVIRNDVYQLGQKVNQIITLLEVYGLSIP